MLDLRTLGTGALLGLLFPLPVLLVHAVDFGVLLVRSVLLLVLRFILIRRPDEPLGALADLDHLKYCLSHLFATFFSPGSIDDVKRQPLFAGQPFEFCVYHTGAAPSA